MALSSIHFSFNLDVVIALIYIKNRHVLQEKRAKQT